jgi:hypothetical protein
LFTRYAAALRACDDNLGLLLGNVSVSSVDAVPAPEPAAMLLLGTGLAGVGASVRRRRKTGKGKVVG